MSYGIPPGNCLFPTAKRLGDKDHFGKVVVSGLDGLLVQPDEDLNIQHDRLQAAWALLLRSYLSEQTVSFGVVLAESNTNGHTRESVHHLTPPAFALIYELHDNRALQDISPIGCRQVGAEDLRSLKINTAIKFNDKTLPQGSNPQGTSLELLNGQIDLVLDVITGASGYEFHLHYRSPAVSEPYAASVLRTFEKIIVAFRSMSMKVGELDVISDVDKLQMARWNPKKLYAQMACVHHLVEGTARIIPMDEAVCAWDGTLTYSQLDLLSSTGAHILAQSGVCPGDFVPFAYEKSMWTVVSTLSILKAGAAFVPLDPQYPTARIMEIFESTKAKVIVTSDQYESHFRSLVGNVVVISSRTLSTPGFDRLERFTWAEAKPSDPVFVLFTSGSTGKPKGMVLEHGAIATHAISHGAMMGYHKARVLQFAAHTFDVAIIDIFTTLIFGGCVCIPSEEDRQANIISVMNEMKVELAILTPLMAGIIEPSDVPTLRTLAVGGEALAQETLDRWVDKVSFIQIYGPAEVGICLAVKMHQGHARADLVGYPLSNCSCWLADPEDSNKLVPPGAIGELIVASPSLARGYLNNEEKTRASFPYHLSWTASLAPELKRFYRTGDLLRYNTDLFDGSFDFVGRIDHQIKLRGQRIEPGEIEYHLNKVPGVDIALVIFLQDGPFAGELVAVVQAGGKDLSHERNGPICVDWESPINLLTVKQYLGKHLPDYMVPTQCFALRSIPVVASLKLDRSQVKAWLTRIDVAGFPADRRVNGNRIGLLRSSETIAWELTQKISSFFDANQSKQLNLEGQDFFLQDIGIDSIQIMSLSLHIQRAYRVKVPFSQLLSSYTTIRGLADMVSTGVESDSSPISSATVDIQNDVHSLTKSLVHRIEEEGFRKEFTTPNVITNIFVTGATGYLGRTMLKHLVQKPGVNIFTLVRCSSPESGFKRIIQSATIAGWWQESYRSQIHVWTGNLEEPNLGLEMENLHLLSGASPDPDLNIDAVVHCGAKVHYSSDYSRLKPTNVSSTSELLSIAARSTSIGTFVFVSGGSNPGESSDLSDPSVIKRLLHSNGYVQTKFVSEKLVSGITNHACFAGKRVRILKPGYIVGSLQTGLANQTDFIWRFIAGCIEIGGYNADEASNWLCITDVDSVSFNAVSAVFDEQFGVENVSCVMEGLTFAELWAVLEGLGYTLVPLDFKTWMTRLKSAILEKGDQHVLFPLLDELERYGKGVGLQQWGPVSVGKGAKGEMNQEQVKDIMYSNVRQLVEEGFLPRPAKGGALPDVKINGNGVRMENAA